MSTPEPSARGEFAAIDAIRAAVAARGARGVPGVAVGIGDDAAVLAPPAGCELVMTTDLLIEGRHFVLGTGGASAADVGWKSLAVSVSDVAAMGGRSLWAVVSVGLPPERSGDFADGLTAGLLECAAEFDVAIVGGDTTSSPGPVVVNVTLVGAVPTGGAVLRSGARPGDAICVTGAIGGSILGRHLRPEPRQEAAAALVQGGDVHAMIDLSDGLSSDLGHVLDASGVGALLWRSAIPVHPDAHRVASATFREPLDHALHDGEDFELLFTVPAARAPELVRDGLAGVPVAWIGDVRAQPGCELRATPESPGPGEFLERRGYDHFRRG